MPLRREETQEQQEKKAAQEQEEREWKFYSDFAKASREVLVLKPEDGSEEHRLAEKFVAKGMLERLLPGMSYAIPGQRFVLGLEPKKRETT